MQKRILKQSGGIQLHPLPNRAAEDGLGRRQPPKTAGRKAEDGRWFLELSSKKMVASFRGGWTAGCSPGYLRASKPTPKTKSQAIQPANPPKTVPPTHHRDPPQPPGRFTKKPFKE